MSETQHLTARERAEAVVRERGYPKRVPRRRLAEIITQEAYEIEYRSLERWSLPTRLLNNKVHLETVDALEYTFKQLDDAPVIRGGQRPKSERQAA